MKKVLLIVMLLLKVNILCHAFGTCRAEETLSLAEKSVNGYDPDDPGYSPGYTADDGADLSISGQPSVLVGTIINFTDATAGGAWSSSNGSVATVDPVTGDVTGIATGAATITYTLSGDYATYDITVDVLQPITGSGSVFAGATITLADVTTGGAWSSSDGSIAIIDPGSGDVTGVSPGTATVTYTVAGIYVTTGITVNTLQAITGPATMFAGTTVTLSDATTGGSWSSSDASLATIDPTTGDVTGLWGSTVTITYSIAGIYVTYPITIYSLPSINGPTSVFVGATIFMTDTVTGGTWSSSDPSTAAIDAVTGMVTGMANGEVNVVYTVGSASVSSIVTVSTLQPVTGPSDVLTGANITLADATTGGVWGSSDGSVANINSITGIATGVSAGTATITYATSGIYVTYVVGVSDLAPVTGPADVFVGATISLADVIAGGSWSSSNSAVATIDPSTGDVAGVSAGSVIITYSVSGVFVSYTVNVSQLSPITGPSNVVIGATITLADANTGGTWTSSDGFVGNVGPATGVVTGISAGTVTITYELSGVYVTYPVAVGTLAPVTGPASILVGTAVTLSDAFPGGTWSSSDVSVASIDPTSGVTTGISLGAAVVTYTAGSMSVTYPVSVDTMMPITGTTIVCIGSSVTLNETTTGGTWSSSDHSVATVNSGGTVAGVAGGTAVISYNVSGIYATTVVTVSPLPGAGTISGLAYACEGASTVLNNIVTGGTWSSSNTTVATVNSSGSVTGIVAGTTTISYSSANSCGVSSALMSFTVMPLPDAGAITGTNIVCEGSAITLSDATGVGVWHSSNTAVATTTSGGVVTGVSAGNTTISYSVTNSCGTVIATSSVTVNPLPGAGAIAGTSTVCEASVATLSDAISGGLWSSSNTSAATIAGDGTITGVSAGSTVISYTITNACGMAVTTRAVTVNPLPVVAAITGADAVCEMASVTLGNTAVGGVWSSSASVIATAGTGGTVTGVSGGTSVISYAISNSCGTAIAAKTITVNSIPSAIVGSSTLCPGVSTTFTDTATGGTWSSSNAAIATIGSSSGIIAGIIPGSVTISYTNTLTGCRAVTAVVVSAPPAISSLGAADAIPLSTFTINGSNFNSTPANNYVSFGDVRATVLTATATALTVQVPVYASFMPISVTSTGCGLTGYSTPFLPVFDNRPYVSGVINFDTHIEDSAGTQPYSIALGDLDGDGKVDIVVTNIVSGTVSVYRNTNTGTGSFSSASFATKVDLSVGAEPYMVAIGDIDGDGKPDMAVANKNSNTVSVFRNISTPGSLTSASFAAKVDFTTPVNPISVAMADIDGDGKPELVTTNIFVPYSVSVFRNTGSTGAITTSTFSSRTDFPTGAAPYYVALGDLDGDGKPDMAIVNENDNTVSVYRNTSSFGSINSSTFATRVDFATGANPVNVQLADMDGDNKLDLLITNQTSNTVSVLRNTATSGAVTSSSFADKVDFTTGSAPISVAVGDLDGDGKPDVIVSNSGSNTMSVFRNTTSSGPITTGSLATKIDFVTGSGPRMITVGDLDGDYIPDVAIAALGANSVSLLRNIPASNPPSIITVTPNVSAAGTTVTITGRHFNPLVTGNTVFFGAVQAIVSTASDTLLTCVAPFGATYNMVAVTNTATISTGYSQYPFLPTYDNSAFVSGTVNMAAKVDFTTATNPYVVAIGDIDGDGKPDVIVSNYGSNTISVLRNTSTTGVLTSGSFAAKVDFTTGSSPIDVKIVDIDGDSKPEIVVANNGSASVSVFRNTATAGSITTASLAAKVDFTTGSSPISVALGDLDGDGRVDIVTSNNLANTISVLRNTASSGTISSGTFAAKVDFATGNRPYAVALADLDKDGKVDIAVANQAANTISLLHNQAVRSIINSSSFATKVDFTTGTSPENLVIVDVDQDGNLDIATVNTGSNTVSVFRNTTSVGSFTSGSFATKVDFATGVGGMGLAVGDIDGDHKPDLVISNQTSGTVSVLRNTAVSGAVTTGSFASRVDFATAANPRYIAVGDLDADGRADIVVANIVANSVSILKNNPIAPIAGLALVCGTGSGAATTLSEITPGGIWTSSNTAVATAGTGTGIITGVANGTTTITYTLPGGRVTKVTTVAAIANPIAGTATVCAGSAATLTDGGGGTWSSSNPAIATVGTGAGIVTGVSAGTTGITYTLASGCNAKKTVTVNPLPNAGTISGTSSVAVASVITLSETATGGAWNCSNTAIATVGAGSVTGVATGSAVISYSVTNSCGTARATMNVTVTPLGGRYTEHHEDTSGGSSLNSVHLNLISIFPNPGNGLFMISGSTGAATDEEVSMEMTDMSGQLVYVKKIAALKGKIDEQISLVDQLPNGMYTLNIRSASESKAFHVVIKQ